MTDLKRCPMCGAEAMPATVPLCDRKHEEMVERAHAAFAEKRYGPNYLNEREAMRAALTAALSAPAPEPATPDSRWREKGEPDPHGDRYNCERAKLCGGHMTDDEVANAVYLEPTIANLTTAKDRIRWLSRALSAPAMGENGGEG